ncbi:tetratricopeptide repeat protein [Nitrospira sp. CMX1]|nr:tetratricopeptide repeat protein [Nitrospira sp.]
MKRCVVLGLIVVMAVGTVGCGGPEERKAKYRLRAQEYFQQGDYSKARVELRNVLQIDPKDVEAYLLYAQVEEKERNWRNAFAAYQQVVELSPNHERALVKLAKYYLEIRAVEQAGQITDRLLATNSDHVQAQAIKIAIVALSGNLKGAVGQAEQLVSRAPMEIDAVLLISSIYASTQRPAEALPYLRQVLQVNPTNLELLDALATISMKQGHTEDAESTLKQIVKLEPTILSHRLRLASFYDQQQQYEKAQAIMQEAVQANPEDERRRVALAEYVSRRRGYESAEAVLQQAKKELPHAGKLWFALGHLYETKGKSEKAREVYHELQTKFSGKPEALEAQVKLAGMDWVAGKTEEAEQQVEAVLKENPRSMEALMLRGRIALQRGKGPDAVADFRSVVKDQPESTDSHVLLAKAHLMTGEPALARESLGRALALNPTTLEAQTMLVGLDAAAGQLKEAKQRLDPLIAQNPGNVALLGMLFQVQLQEKDWGKTQDTLHKLRQAGADENAADLAEGHVALVQQRWDTAEAAYRRAAERQPSAAEPLLALVQMDMRRGRLASAQSRLEYLLAKSSNHPYANGLLGELLLTKGESAAAITHFETATRLNPKWTTPWIHLARTHYAQKRAAEGDTVLRTGVENNPESEQLRLLLAMSLATQGHYDDAINQYEAVLRRAPSSILAANNLAAVLVDHKGDPKSLERALTLSRGFESQKPNAYLLDTLGWTHHKMGHQTDAVRILQQAMTLVPDHPILNYHLGAAYAKGGQRTEALTHLKKALASGTAFEGSDEAKSLLGKVSG